MPAAAVAALLLAAPMMAAGQAVLCDQMLRCKCHEAPSEGGCQPMSAYKTTLFNTADVDNVASVQAFASVGRQVVMAVRVCIPQSLKPGSAGFKAEAFVNRAAMCLSLSRNKLGFNEYLLVSDVLAEGIAALGRSSLDFGAKQAQSGKSSGDVLPSGDVLASAAKARMLSQLARDGVPDSQQAVPVFTAAFWQDTGGFTALGKQLDQYVTIYNTLLQEREKKTFLGSVFLQGFKNTSLNALKPAEGSLVSSSLSSDQLIATARDANARMQEAQKPLPAMLEQVNTDCKAKIEAVKEFEKKELQVKRANAIFNLIKSTVSLAASVLTAGASSAAKFTKFWSTVKAAAAKGSKVPLKNLPGLFRRQVSEAAKNAGDATAATYEEVKFDLTEEGNKTRLEGRLNETKDLVKRGKEMVGKLDEALKAVESDDPMHAAMELLRAPGNPLSDVADIADALSVFANEQQELARIDAQAKGSLEKLDRGMSLAQSQLSRLMEQAAAISLTILKTVEWMSDDAVTLGDTEVPSSLFEAPEVWTTTVEQIISILEENEACPDPAAPNPFAERRLLLSALARPESLQLRGGAPSAASGDARLLQIYERSAATATSPVDAAEFRRALGFKPSSDKERKAAFDAFENLRGSCGLLAEQLKKFAMWAQSSHKALYDAVRAIRDVLLGRIQLDAANANVLVWDAALKSVQSEVDKSFSAEFLLAGHGEAIEQGATSAVEALCRAFRYAQPLVNQPDVTVVGSGASGTLDMKACRVMIGSDPTAVAPSMVGRIQTLLQLINAADEPLRKSGLVNFQQDAGGAKIGQRVEYAASCALKSTSFMDELLNSKPRQAQFDVRFGSFAGGDGKASSACQDNAEFESMLVVFRDANGDIVPNPETHPNTRIDVAIEPVQQRSMFKYLQVGKSEKNFSQWRELTYELQGRYAFGISYRTIRTGDDCDKSQTKEVLTSAGRSASFCVQRTIAGDSLPFSRLPVFGTWQVTLPKEWPSDVPRPASVEIKINHFANGLASCASDASAASILSTSTERQRRTSVSTRATMIGANICGGRPQVRLGEVPVADDAGTIAGAVIGALLILAVVPAMVWYLRRRDEEERAEWAGHQSAVDVFSAGRGARDAPQLPPRTAKDPPARRGSPNPQYGGNRTMP
jgi:hypothetical protein